MPGHTSKGTEPSCPSWQHPKIRFDWEGRKRLGTSPGREEGDAAFWGHPTPHHEKGPAGSDWAPGLSSICHLRKAPGQVGEPALLPKGPVPRAAGRDIAWVWWHMVTRSSYKEQKAARGQPCSPLTRIFTHALEATYHARCHFSFSRLLFLWLASSSSFLSSRLWSWALLAGARDLSLVPLPA